MEGGGVRVGMRVDVMSRWEVVLFHFMRCGVQGAKMQGERTVGMGRQIHP